MRSRWIYWTIHTVALFNGLDPGDPAELLWQNPALWALQLSCCDWVHFGKGKLQHLLLFHSIPFLLSLLLWDSALSHSSNAPRHISCYSSPSNPSLPCSFQLPPNKQNKVLIHHLAHSNKVFSLQHSVKSDILTLP